MRKRQSYSDTIVPQHDTDTGKLKEIASFPETKPVSRRDTTQEAQQKAKTKIPTNFLKLKFVLYLSANAL